MKRRQNLQSLEGCSFFVLKTAFPGDVGHGHYYPSVDSSMFVPKQHFNIYTLLDTYSKPITAIVKKVSTTVVISSFIKSH